MINFNVISNFVLIYRLFHKSFIIFNLKIKYFISKNICFKDFLLYFSII